MAEKSIWCTVAELTTIENPLTYQIVLENAHMFLDTHYTFKLALANI